MRHTTLYCRGVRIHAVEEGAGPLVLLIHGFPESWYSWRHQLGPIAQAGFRAVAIDVRGYGRSSAPWEIPAYSMLALVTDVLGAVEALEESAAVVVGHDWGAPIASAAALLRPDVFKAVAMLSVPYSPPGKRRPTEAFAEMGRRASERAGTPEQFYISYFQQPGAAEAEAEPDVRSWLRGFYLAASGEYASRPGPSIATVPVGGRLSDRFPHPASLPGWLSEEDLDFYAGEFERTGLRGGLNRYRNVDRDWEDLAPWREQPIRVPSLFIGGEHDGPTLWGARAIERFERTLPDLRGCHLLSGCGHWVQQERPAEVTQLLVSWLEGL
jgi:pimeloyl-ACP methyl ester carboxylesterase